MTGKSNINHVLSEALAHGDYETAAAINNELQREAGYNEVNM